MSTLPENSSFDVESYLSLLEEDGQTGDDNNGKQALMRIILPFRSTEPFEMADNHALDHSSSSSSSSSASATDYASAFGLASATDYASTSGSPNDQILDITDQGLETAVALEISADSTDHEDVPISAHPKSDIYEDNIELQQIQRICPRKPTQPFSFLVIFFSSFVGACNNYTIFLLSFAAVLSLGFGIVQKGLQRGWLDSASLACTIIVLVFCTTVQKFWEKWSSNKKLEDSWQSNGKKIQVLVIRAGVFQFVRVLDLVVGDIVALRKGDQVPGDGSFINGEALELDTGSISSITIDEQNPFLFYGSRVINGNAQMLVTATCMDTAWGEMMSQVKGSAGDKCKFESYIDKLSTCIHISGLLIFILIITVLFLRYEAGKLDDESSFRLDQEGKPTLLTIIVDAIEGIITGSRGTTRGLMLLSVSLLGIMEGMPFVITLATITWSSKILEYKASARDYLACFKMASVTTICSDKLGGLTEYGMEVDKFFVGEEIVNESSVVASKVLEGLCDGIGTLFLICPTGCESKVIPLISWAKAKLGMKEESVKEQCKVISYEGYNPFEECCQVLLEKSGNEGQKRYLHYKGPPRCILHLCSHYYNITGEIQELDSRKRMMMEHVIENMLSEESEVIAYARDFVNESDVALVGTNDLIFMGMISLKDAKWHNVKNAVSTLRKGGITTILTSKDDVAVLQIIGQNSGLVIPGSGDLVLTGEEFRAWTDEEKIQNIEKIRIIGNCLPNDKILVIKSLREKGKVVALLGQRTADAPALKLADIGFTFGTWSSEVAIESSDINIWNGDFSFLVSLVKKGRYFQEKIQKFIQLQLIVTISSSLINFTATVFLGDAPITTVQLLWLNLVVSFVGGLDLVIGPSAKTLMTMEPLKSSTMLISKAIWRNIVIQASYQTIIFVTLQHKGHAILGISDDLVKSVIYNGFFICHIFNKFIARELENRNIFRCLFREERWFWVAVVLFLMCQAVFVMAEKVVSNSPGLNWKLWAVCLLIAAVSLLLDWAGKTASNLTIWRARYNGGNWKLGTFTRLVSANN